MTPNRTEQSTFRARVGSDSLLDRRAAERMLPFVTVCSRVDIVSPIHGIIRARGMPLLWAVVAPGSFRTVSLLAQH